MPKHISTAASCKRFPGLTPRSTARLQYERFIHSLDYPFIIHPYSLLRYYWDLFMCGMTLLHVLLSTVVSYYHYHGEIEYHISLMVLHTIETVDMLSNFITGYVKEDETVVLNSIKVAKNYLTKWFVIDLLGVVPFESVSYFISNCVPVDLKKHPRKINDCHFYVDLVSFNFIFRISAFHRYFNRIARLKLLNIFWVRLTIYTLWVFSLFSAFFNMIALVPSYYPYQKVWTTNVTYADCFYTDNPPSECVIFKKLNLFICIILSVVNEDYFYDKDLTFLEIVIRGAYYYVYFFSIIFLMAFCAYICIYAKSPKDRFHETQSYVQAYIHKKQFPDKLGKKMLLYYQTLLEKKYFNEEDIYDFLPDSERNKFMLKSTLHIIQKAPIFMQVPEEILKQLSYLLRYEVFLPEEAIVSAGDYGTNMFFIVYGTVFVYAKNFVKIWQFEDGDHFGEKSIVFPDKRLNASAVAVKICCTYYLTRDDFLGVMQSYPAVLDDLQRKLMEEKEKR